jgi:hypothetical protein
MKDLTEVASLSGKGGLYKVLKPGRAGVILESLDDNKTRMVTNPTHKVSILAEISVYTNTEEGAAPLEDLFKKIYKEFGDDPGVDGKSTPEELMSFLEYILPEYDTARVYPSDVKKLVNWYGILLKEAPELLKEKMEDKEGKKGATQKEQETKAVKSKSENAEAVSREEASDIKNTDSPKKSSGKTKKKGTSK